MGHCIIPMLSSNDLVNNCHAHLHDHFLSCPLAITVENLSNTSDNLRITFFSAGGRFVKLLTKTSPNSSVSSILRRPVAMDITLETFRCRNASVSGKSNLRLLLASDSFCANSCRLFTCNSHMS